MSFRNTVHRKAATLLTLGMAIACLACGATDPGDRSETIVFHDTQAFTYGGSSCAGTFDLYCGTWAPDSHSFSGTLMPGKELMVSGIAYGYEEQNGAAQYKRSGVCDTFTLPLGNPESGS